MGLIKAFSGAIGGTFADQWKDIITAGKFDEHMVVSSGIFITSNNNRGTNSRGSVNIISNGSKIYVPENTAVVILNQGSIEEIVIEPGGYEYQNGQESLFNGDGVRNPIVTQAIDRFKFGGQTADNRQILFVNMREIRGIKFGTKGPQIYHDMFYDVDLEVLAFGSFSLRVTNPTILIQNLIPANVNEYSFDDSSARSQLLSEFIQSFTIALNKLSNFYRVSELPSKSSEISKSISEISGYTGNWSDRFGIQVISVGVENIEFSDDSRNIIKKYSSDRLSINAYNNISQNTANIAAQQKIAQGIQNNGLGDGAGMVMGMNMMQDFGPNVEAKSLMTLDEQIQAVTKFKKLLDEHIISEDEFNQKKKEIMGL